MDTTNEQNDGVPTKAGGAPSMPPASDEREGSAADELSGIEQKIIESIQTVFDPEIPVNIYALGLIYDVDVQPSGNVQIKMTLTSPACPSAQELPLEVRRAAGRVDGVKDVEVDVVFDPPWTPDNMSDEAKVQLGMM